MAEIGGVRVQKLTTLGLRNRLFGIAYGRAVKLTRFNDATKTEITDAGLKEVLDGVAKIRDIMRATDELRNFEVALGKVIDAVDKQRLSEEVRLAAHSDPSSTSVGVMRHENGGHHEATRAAMDVCPECKAGVPSTITHGDAPPKLTMVEPERKGDA